MDILDPAWHLSPVGKDFITNSGSIKDRKQILQLALNTDLKEICNPVLNNELSKNIISKLVLQIQKIRNISAPKVNEESQAAPRMLKLSLSDGIVHIQALEISPIKFISLSSTAPGTKVLINNAKISSGYILLTPNNCTVLGGNVPYLIEKWEQSKSRTESRIQQRSVCNDGPPPWVNFGVKIQSSSQDKFSSLDNKSKDTNRENSEFELQRQTAIAEATSGAVKKVFGGRVRQSTQPLSKDQTKALEKKEYHKNRSKNLPKEKEMNEKPAKPSEKVSLFSFLEEKLPATSYEDSQKGSNTANTYQQGKMPQFQETCDKHFEKLPSANNFKQNNMNGILRNNPTCINAPSTYQSNFNSSITNNGRQYNNYRKNDNHSEYRKNNFQSYTVPNSNVDKSLSTSSKQELPQSSTASGDSMNNSKKNLEDATANMKKMSLNSQFASRSLKQHLNLGHSKKKEEFVQEYSNWKIGDECLAKYWEDGKFYPATIMAVTNKTFAVKFSGYGNIEEILKSDCLPVTEKNKQNYKPQKRYDQKRPYYGSMEFRRNPNNYN